MKFWCERANEGVFGSPQVMDLLVLFILHSTNANQSRRGAERLLKVKVRTGIMQEALLQRTFRDFAQVRLVALSCALGAHHRKTVVACCFDDGLISDVYRSGHAGVFPLHPRLGSEFAALPRPLRGAFRRTHVPPLVHRLWLLLPAGGSSTSVSQSVIQ